MKRKTQSSRKMVQHKGQQSSENSLAFFFFFFSFCGGGWEEGRGTLGGIIAYTADRKSESKALSHYICEHISRGGCLAKGQGWKMLGWRRSTKWWAPNLRAHLSELQSFWPGLNRSLGRVTSWKKHGEGEASLNGTSRHLDILIKTPTH